MKKTLSFVFVALALTGCEQTTNSNQSNGSEPQVAVEEQSKQTIDAGINYDNMDKKVHPGDDFFAYVNGNWLTNTEIPADKSSYGIGRMVHDESVEKVKQIIEDSSKGSFEQGTDEQKVGDLFNSYLDMENRTKLGVEPLKVEIAKIDALTDKKQLAAYFAYANKLGYGTPFNLVQFPDLKKPTHYAMYALQSGIGLPDKEYYLKSDEKSTLLRGKYSEHVATMLSLAGIEGSKTAAEAVITLESELAKHQMDKEKTRDIVGLYNKVEVSKLTEIMPNFDWQGYLLEAGLADSDYIVVAMVDYTKALDGIINNTDMESWKSYLKWHLVNATATRLNEALDKQNFAFYGTEMSGTKEQQESWRRAVGVVNGTLGEVIGKVYVKRHFPPQAKVQMKKLVDNLIAAYEISIKELSWMGEETKKEALDKLSKFNPKIGYPDVWKDYSRLEIKRDDLFGNLQRAALVSYQQNIERQKKPVDKNEWGMTPQTVNAYYNPPLNEIVFPAAILQPPYFNLNADSAVNYGAIGAVIGHEIGHGFDDSGSTFDGDGVLRNWWTDEDKKEFEIRTGQLIKQYDGFKLYEDLNVNGTFTLGENIGDLGGLSIALKAYKMSLMGKDAPMLDGYTGIQRVFLGYGQAWMFKGREEAVRQRTATDPHSPPEFRVNGVVRNLPEFYLAFDVTPENKLYLAEEERVKIW
ncbi:MAG: peptidase M13 [Kangiellaceae bacterium]|nr:peptidase M13 [Kangiellaceae bacterium]